MSAPLLLGAGPSPVPERVLHALAQPTIGHLDARFGEIMDRCSASLREVFGTENRATLPVSATGRGGMQAMVDNFAAAGDRIVCGVHGLFGARMADALERAGADVVRVEAPWGRAIPTEALLKAAEPGMRAMFVVHAETSTGVLQPLAGLADCCAAHDALLLVDCVTSLGGLPVELDAQGIDVAFAGTQKCLNCPPGLAPFSAGARALERLPERSRSWYFDLRLLLGYWDGASGGGRSYHHTAPINMIYGLDEALRILLEEGLESRFARHARAHEALRSALSCFGLERIAPEGEQLCSLLAVRVPPAIDEAGVRGELLQRHGIEISSGVGEFAGRAWRIGVMGEGARLEPQRALVSALAELLPGEGALEALAAGWS
ncbi:MAG: pyridoxal-phosphate-dependent aminotransferase family protein [Solirubrobacteraceae bacterium]